MLDMKMSNKAARRKEQPGFFKASYSHSPLLFFVNLCHVKISGTGGDLDLIYICTSKPFGKKISPQTWLCKNIPFFNGMHYFPSCQSTNKLLFFIIEENTVHKFKEKPPNHCIKLAENALLNAYNSSCFFLCSYFPVDDTLRFNTFKGHKL